MEQLKCLLYGEYGILYRLENVGEDDIVNAEKEELIMLAKRTNEKYHAGMLSNEELMMYFDVFDVFASFQDVDWVRELTAELYSTLTKKVKHNS